MKREELGKQAPVLVIGGPTASGKSQLALRLAEALGGAVINGDAMQVYRELSVLTARPSTEEMRRVPHRLYGVLPAAERCSVARWRDMAMAAICETRREGQLPIVVGGTGLYLRALMEGLAPVPDIPADVRAQARSRHAELGAAEFHAELARLDPVMGQRLKSGDTQRVLRAWEVITATGRSLASFHAVAAERSGEHFLPIILLPPRDALYAACDARCVRMLEDGAIEEVRQLLAHAPAPDVPAMKALGVREITSHLAGARSREEMLAALQQATRNYAKRQLTWFRHQLPEAQVYAAQLSERVFEEIFSFIRKSVDPARPSR